ncbi:MAG: exopolyphosphatase [Arcobacter sp.]|uniref:Ppx/GppA phosphatase family protein n=1 Tax=uncultured Arcobacter sp. TaxID=165434 RepID=UPI000CAFB1EA|nr:exopolyphosphatase [uncultured Arcobacter sp.]PLY11352.1 MAG: exopolyphosphatase [Arcobacter sp.]
MKNIVSVDLGSNSFRTLLYDGLNHKIIDEYQEVVGMADGLIDTNKISNEAQDRVIDAVKRSIAKLKYNPEDAICVTTAAMRMAKNSSEVLKRFKDECKLDFKIIDGEEEARLTLLAIKYALKREKKESEHFILIDIGGGSTELIINSGDSHFAKSFDIGIVTLAQKHKNSETIISELEKRKSEIAKFITALNIDLKNFNFVATAGTPTTIAAVKLGLTFATYNRDLINGTELYLEEIESFLNKFRSLSQEEIFNLVGPGRTDFIESGVFIYKLFYEILNKDKSIVFDDGLREGVAIDYALKSNK